MVDSRDIELVLITGAGASREFGRDNKPLPLMTQWCDAIVEKLGGVPGYVDATGLSTSVDGIEFERRLGHFLKAAAALESAKDLIPETSMLPGVAEHTSRAQLIGWHNQATFQISQIQGKIYESLYEQFGPDATNEHLAKQSYEALFGQLKVSLGHSLVVATTNYDVLAETALAEIGRRPDWGEPIRPRGGAESHLLIEGLLDGLPRFTPVLHLHGRVGWFRRSETLDRVSSALVARYQPELGAPVIVLPDPEKVYDDPIFSAMWPEFLRALDRARRVFVLGHSLHDDALVDALREHVQPLSRLAVGVYPAGASVGGYNFETDDLTLRCRERLPDARIVVCKFGATVDIREDQLNGWLAVTYT
jgi:hypothetical protein